MFRNYCKIAFRNLKKHKVFSFVNIAGLAVGLSVFWMIALYIADEMSYDRFLPHADRIYRVVHSGNWDRGSFRLAQTPVPFGPALRHDYSEIEQSVRIDAEGGGILRYGDKKIKAGDMLFTDSSFFSVFGYPFLFGDPAEALTKPQSIVLTKSLAEKLFGSAGEALNKTLLSENDYPMLVTGVLQDLPANSHIGFSALRAFPAGYAGGWMNSQVYTYVLLNGNADPKKLEAKFPGFFDRYIRQAAGNLQYKMELQPLTSIHLHSNLQYEIGSNSDIRYVYIFSAVAFLILLLAAINYINLSTARSSIRIKEIGVRKVTGSGRGHLVAMFLTESVLFTLGAAAISVILANFSLPFFNRLSGKELSLWQFGAPATFLALSLFSLLVGLLSGIYPAFFLSGFRTIPALKGQMGNLSGNILFRRSLVTFQFAITVIMVSVTLIIYQQLHYVANRDLGFDKSQVLSFHIDDQALRGRIPALKARLLQSTLIEGAASASNPIGNNNIGEKGFFFEEKEGMSRNARSAQNFMVDADYLKTLGVKLVQGRNFSEDRPADQFGSVLINETLAKALGWPDPVGKKVQYRNNGGVTTEASVIGVVRDFNIYSLQHTIEPLVLIMPPNRNEEDNLYVRVSKNNVPAAIRTIESSFRQFDDHSPFEYKFLDENFAKQYDTEKKQGSILLTFTLLAIFIAGLGLFGLVTFTAAQRTKEIGIRKVLGAGVGSIVALLSRDLLKLVGLAIILAIPVAWYIMQYWLSDFAYRVAISWPVFLLAGSLTIVIALLTTGIRAIKAAIANPVKALRSE